MDEQWLNYFLLLRESNINCRVVMRCCTVVSVRTLPILFNWSIEASLQHYVRMDDVKDIDNWEYRAEGNLHVIVANLKTTQVLRLLKCSKDRRIYDELSSNEATESEISFVRHVAHPLMRNCKACFPVQQVRLSKDFMRIIAKKIEPDRPKCRLHKMIDQSRRFGILMPDLCQILPPPPASCGITISIEIKPKQGFILTGDNTCRFSQFQRLKVQSKAYERESSYCPVDLFSGCRKRMQKAIKGLVLDPQNNLRVFKNGNIIYSQELIKERQEKAKEIFRSTVLSHFLGHVSDCLNAAEQLKYASQNFHDLLCNLLLYPVCEENCNVTHLPQQCVDNRTDEPQPPSKFPEARLPSSCILGLLLSLQKLEKHSVDEYYEMYGLIKRHLDLFPGDAEELSLEGPYDAQHWQDIVEEVCRFDNQGPMQESDNSCMREVTKTATLLRKFLIATSFKDCSIIMTFQLKKEQEVPRSNRDIPMTMRTRHGQEYWASLAIIDSDPKSASRIPEYYQNACSNTRTV